MDGDAQCQWKAYEEKFQIQPAPEGEDNKSTNNSNADNKNKKSKSKSQENWLVAPATVKNGQMPNRQLIPVRMNQKQKVYNLVSTAKIAKNQTQNKKTKAYHLLTAVKNAQKQIQNKKIKMDNLVST